MIKLLLGQRLLASGEAAPRVYNWSLFCPVCGEVWGRILDDPENEWRPFTQCCLKHSRSAYEVSGSFFQFQWCHETLVQEWLRGNPALLRHEFNAYTLYAQGVNT